MRSFWISLVLCILLATSAHAALLTNIQGRVLLNTGNGFAPVTGSVQVNPGDRIQIVGDGSAQIVYENGFVGTVGSNQTVAVLGSPPAPAGFAGVSTPVIIGGVVVIGGVVAAVAAGSGGSSNNSSVPVSP